MANKGAPSGMLSIVGRRCAWSETGCWEKKGKEVGCWEPGGGDMKESEVGEVDCRMKARAMRAFNSF